MAKKKAKKNEPVVKQDKPLTNATAEARKRKKTFVK
jgi:hypothetical protein